MDEGALTQRRKTGLPEGSKLISVQSHKSFLLDHIFKITVELVDRSIKAFFLKLAEGDVGCSKLEGEFEGVKAIYAVVPAHVPRPIACGAFTSTPSTYFYLAEFVSMKRKFLQPQAFGALLAKLHKDSTPLSPNGKFGFHVTTYAVCTFRGIASFISLSHRTFLSTIFLVERSHKSTVSYEWKD